MLTRSGEELIHVLRADEDAELVDDGVQKELVKLSTTKDPAGDWKLFCSELRGVPRTLPIPGGDHLAEVEKLEEFQSAGGVVMEGFEHLFDSFDTQTLEEAAERTGNTQAHLVANAMSSVLGMYLNTCNALRHAVNPD